MGKLRDQILGQSEQYKQEMKRATDETTCFRSVFFTGFGKKALAYLLIELGWDREARTPEEAALQNFAIRLLQRLGVIDMQPGSVQMEQIVEHLSHIPQTEITKGIAHATKETGS